MLEYEEILARIQKLPPAPVVLARVMSIVDDPEAGVTDLVSAIEVDPGVTANVLRMCNSPYYAGNRQLSTLDEAVHRVGMRTIVQLVMVGESESLLGGAHEGYGLAPGDLWRHSMSVALACRILARRIGFSRVSLAFTGGLLHDLGKIVLDVFLKRRYHEVRQKVDLGATFQEAEREVLGMEHAELGSRITDSWSFPTTLQQVIRYHHQPEESEDEKDLCALVHLGDAVSHWLGIGLGRPGLSVRFETSAVSRFGLRPDDLDRVLIELVEKIAETEHSLAA